MSARACAPSHDIVTGTASTAPSYRISTPNSGECTFTGASTWQVSSGASAGAASGTTPVSNPIPRATRSSRQVVSSLSRPGRHT